MSPESHTPLPPTPSLTYILGFKRINPALQRKLLPRKMYLLRGTFLRWVKSWAGAGRICLLTRTSLKHGFSPAGKGEPFSFQYSRWAELQSKFKGSHCLKFYIFPKWNSLSPLWTVAQGLLYEVKVKACPMQPPKVFLMGSPEAFGWDSLSSHRRMVAALDTSSRSFRHLYGK